MKDAKGYGKGIQLRLEGFLHEDKGEPENNVEAPSITSTSERGRNDVKTSILLNRRIPDETGFRLLRIRTVMWEDGR
ncbi:MAG: RNA-directed polymerase [Petrotoga sp.]|nr:RNA-directed polymerase [Petrotoga sp.]